MGWAPFDFLKSSCRDGKFIGDVPELIQYSEENEIVAPAKNNEWFKNNRNKRGVILNLHLH
jgi:hypothetical protein